MKSGFNTPIGEWRYLTVASGKNINKFHLLQPNITST